MTQRAAHATSAMAPNAALQAQAPHKRDWAPALSIAALLLLGWLASGGTTTWLTLTFAGIASGMILFVAACGLTLVFGLMHVMNFAHGLFIALGGYLAWATINLVWSGAAPPSGGPQAALALGLAAIVAVLACAALGVLFERVVVRPAQGQALKQILITTGAMIVGEEIIKLVWGAQQLALPLPAALRGAYVIGGVPLEKYRLLATAVGLLTLAVLLLVLTRSKIGLLIRAGVADGEMVEALGYPIRRLGIAVFAGGCALAGLGGVTWGLYQQSVTPQSGQQLSVLIFIIIIIGGLGSVGGCLVGALLVGLLNNYAGYAWPKAALVAHLVLLVAVMLWRPRGLVPSASHAGDA